MRLGIILDTVLPKVAPDISSSSKRKQSNQYDSKARPMDRICKTPFNFREWILLILLIISGVTFLALVALVLADKRPHKDIQCYSNTTAISTQVYGVQTTYHGAHEAGACELPVSY